MDISEHKSKTEAQLVADVIAGDQQAFSVLFKQLYPRVYRTVYGMLGDEASATEVTQTVWVKAWQKRDNYNFKASYSTWIHRIAVNSALDELKRKRRYWSRFTQLLSREDLRKESGQAFAGRSDPAKDMQTSERHAELHAAIAQLPEAQRLTLVLKEFENYTYAEIASILGCKVGTVMSRLHTARNQMQRILNPESK